MGALVLTDGRPVAEHSVADDPALRPAGLPGQLHRGAARPPRRQPRRAPTALVPGQHPDRLARRGRALVGVNRENRKCVLAVGGNADGHRRPPGLAVHGAVAQHPVADDRSVAAGRRLPRQPDRRVRRLRERQELRRRRWPVGVDDLQGGLAADQRSTVGEDEPNAQTVGVTERDVDAHPVSPGLTNGDAVAEYSIATAARRARPGPPAQHPKGKAIRAPERKTGRALARTCLRRPLQLAVRCEPRGRGGGAEHERQQEDGRAPNAGAHSTVTVFARLRGWSTSKPRARATW